VRTPRQVSDRCGDLSHTAAMTGQWITCIS